MYPFQINRVLILFSLDKHESSHISIHYCYVLKLGFWVFLPVHSIRGCDERGHRTRSCVGKQICYNVRIGLGSSMLCNPSTSTYTLTLLPMLLCHHDTVSYTKQYYIQYHLHVSILETNVFGYKLNLDLKKKQNTHTKSPMPDTF